MISIVGKLTRAKNECKKYENVLLDMWVDEK